MTAHAYASLAAISHATEQITENIERLKADGLINSELADVRKLAAEETRAVVCHSAALSLADREQGEAASVEKERLVRERKLADL